MYHWREPCTFVWHSSVFCHWQLPFLRSCPAAQITNQTLEAYVRVRSHERLQGLNPGNASVWVTAVRERRKLLNPVCKKRQIIKHGLKIRKTCVGWAAAPKPLENGDWKQESLVYDLVRDVSSAMIESDPWRRPLEAMTALVWPKGLAPRVLAKQQEPSFHGGVKLPEGMWVPSWRTVLSLEG